MSSNTPFVDYLKVFSEAWQSITGFHHTYLTALLLKRSFTVLVMVGFLRKAIAVVVMHHVLVEQ